MWSRVLPKGTPIRVVQSIQTGTSTWETAITGIVESWIHEETGAWYAHGQFGKMWLPRVCIRKLDGELTVLTVDRMTEIAPLAPATWVYKPPSPLKARPPTLGEETGDSTAVPDRKLVPLPGIVAFAPPDRPRIVVGKADSENAPVHAETGCFQLPRPRDGRRLPLKLTRPVVRLADSLW